MNRLKVLITGATGGLGSALAIQLAHMDADLLLLDKASKDLDALSDEICAQHRAEPGVCTLDLAKSGPAEHQNLFNILQEEYGGLDAIIHCAAAFQGLQPIEQVSAEQWHECMQVNVNAAWLLTTTCLPLLKASDRGRVVFVQDDIKISTSAYWGAYGVSKAALRSLGQMLEEEFEGTGMKVLNFEPGPLRTQLRARAYLAEKPELLRDPVEAARCLINELFSSFSS